MPVTAPPLPSAVPAGLWLRLLAAVYDLLPLLALAFLAAVLALAVTAGALDVSRPGHRVLVQMLVLGLGAGYFVLSWIRGGQTLGMRPWRLRVVSADGGAVSARQALLRLGVAALSLAAAGIGFWWALFDAQQRTWHDLAAGTLMVRMERS